MCVCIFVAQDNKTFKIASVILRTIEVLGDMLGSMGDVTGLMRALEKRRFRAVWWRWIF